MQRLLYCQAADMTTDLNIIVNSGDVQIAVWNQNTQDLLRSPLRYQTSINSLEILLEGTAGGFDMRGDEEEKEEEEKKKEKEEEEEEVGEFEGST
ncbi:hypothetical protein Pmani_026126, partial [Petrolisthes manimaculis]